VKLLPVSALILNLLLKKKSPAECRYYPEGYRVLSQEAQINSAFHGACAKGEKF
jgi:hypothetical protein